MFKHRSIVLCIILSIITFGIYGIYWFARLTTETNNLSQKHKSANGLLAIVFCVITGGIYTFYWAYKIGQRVGEIEGEGSSGVLFLILMLFAIGSIVIPCLAQSAINNH